MSFLLKALAVTWQQAVMYVVGIILIWLAVKRNMNHPFFCPGFWRHTGQLPYSGVVDQMVQERPAAGIIEILFKTGISFGNHANPAFIRIGAMIDFGPLLSQPVLFLFGAAASLNLVAILIASYGL